MMKTIQFVLFCFTTSLIINLVESSRRCQQAPNWLVKGRNPIIEKVAEGNVVVLSLVSSKSKQFLLHTLDALNNYGRHYLETVREKVKIIVINGQGRKLPQRLIDRFPYIKIYDEPEDKQIFKKLRGQAWDVLVYDVCGRMQFRYVYPYSWLGFPFLSRAINYAIGKYEHVCGKCKPLSEYSQLPARFPPTIASSHIPAEVVAITANNDLAEGLRVTKRATTLKPVSVIGHQEELYEEVHRPITVVITNSSNPHEKTYEGLPSTAKTTIQKTLKSSKKAYDGGQERNVLSTSLRSSKPSETSSKVGYKSTLLTTRRTTLNSVKPSENPSNVGYKSTLFTKRKTTLDSVKPSKTPSNVGYKNTLFTTRKTTPDSVKPSENPSNVDYKSTIFTARKTTLDSVKASENPSNVGYKGTLFTTRKTTLNSLKPSENPSNAGYKSTPFTTRKTTLNSLKPSENPSNAGYESTLFITKTTTLDSVKTSEDPSNVGYKSTPFAIRKTTLDSLETSEDPSNVGYKSTPFAIRKTTLDSLDTSVVPYQGAYETTTTQEPIHESTKESEEPPIDVTTTVSTLESFISSEDPYEVVYWSTTGEPTQQTLKTNGRSYERLGDSTTKKSLKEMLKLADKKFGERLNGNTTQEITQKSPTDSGKQDKISIVTKMEVPQSSLRPHNNDSHKEVNPSTAGESTQKMLKTNDEQAHVNYTTKKQPKSLNQSYEPYQRAHGIPIFIDKEKYRTIKKMKKEYIGTPVPVTTRGSTVDPKDVRNFIVSRLNKFLHTKYNSAVTTARLGMEENGIGTSTEFYISTDSSDAKPTKTLPVKRQKDELDRRIMAENRKLQEQILKAQHLMNPQAMSDKLLFDYYLQNNKK